MLITKVWLTIDNDTNSNDIRTFENKSFSENKLFVFQCSCRRLNSCFKFKIKDTVKHRTIFINIQLPCLEVSKQQAYMAYKSRLNIKLKFIE